MYFTVYETTNLINGKKYRGAHKCKNPHDGYLGSGNIIESAVGKYGKNNFTKEILEYCNDVEHMYEREAHWVDRAWVDRHDTYNTKTGGFANFYVSEGTRRKISKVHSGKAISEEVKKRISETLAGRKLTHEHRSNIGLGQLGAKRSDEIKKKMSKAQKDREHGPHSPETKAKMSVTRKGRVSPNKGKKHGPYKKRSKTT